MKRYFIFCIGIFFSLFLYGNVYFKHLGKNEGLSQISVKAIGQDELGRIWLGTLEGLNCYDGNKVTSYNAQTNPLIGNEIHCLVCDRKGNVFFISDGRLIRYALREEQFYDMHLKASALFAGGQSVWASVKDSIFEWNAAEKEFQPVCQIPSARRINSLYVEENGGIWAGTTRGVYRMESLSDPNPVCVLPGVMVSSLFQDSRQRLWVAGYRDGMYQISRNEHQEWSVRSDWKLPNNDIRCFVEDEEGSVWAGTFDGLYRIDSKGMITGYRKDVVPGTLSHSSVFSLYKDSQGSIWVGTFYGGVNYFNPVFDIFRHYADYPGREDCLSYAYVGNMVEDKRGDVWICTEGGGLNRFHRGTQKFSHYLNDSSRPSSFFPNLKCIEYNRDEDCLYIGTHKQGVLRYDIASGEIYREEDWKKMGPSFSKICLQGDSLLLLADYGLFVQEKDRKVRHLFPGTRNSCAGGIDFCLDSKGNVWISFRDRLVRIHLKDIQNQSVYKYGEKGLGRFPISKIVEASDGKLYLGSFGSGIYTYDCAADSFVPYPDVPLRYCYALQTTEDGFLVASGDKGVFVCHPKTGKVKMLDAEKQLHLSAVNDGCGLLYCRNGEMLVGGTEGMSSFMLSRLFSPYPSYNLFFSFLEVNNRQITVQGEEKVLSEALPFSGKLNLAYNQNNIQLTFSSNNYIESAKPNLYEYCLKGFDKGWHTAYSHSLVFTNLEPGDYKLIVREKADGGQSNTHVLELPVTVHEPWWNTWQAYLVYVCLCVLIGYELLKNWRTKMHLRHSLAQEKLEKEKQEELTQAKLQFFANISHEFRTPLTLIIAQSEALLQSSALSPYLRTRLQRIYRTTFQFKELISELLDFRKIERGKLTLHVCHTDLVPFLRLLSEEFRNQAQLKQVAFSLQTQEEELYCWVDSRQLRKVVSNLLSNAFKYTPAGGKVELSLERKGEKAEIKVIDTGTGIPEASLPFVFDRFYQAEGQTSSQGSGIGLALAKSIVELHHGEIAVRSVVDYGSIFTVTLPMENLFQEEDNVVFVSQGETDEELAGEAAEALEPIVQEGEETALPEVPFSPETRYTLLLVEDNEEMLQVLVDILSPLYKVVIAMNGQEGLDKAQEEQPDLILSDVMMPVMSGTEMCGKLKSNFDLCHIPVILLTALSSESNHLEGLQCGADDYIEKPFSHKLLLGKIANVLRNRKLLARKYSVSDKEEESGSEDMPLLALNPLDARFLSQLETVVKEHLADSELDVNMLAQYMGVSRSSLYGKLKVLCHMTPNEFVLRARLSQAVHLLDNNPELQITEIAYQAGFNSPRYFRHCFKAHFNQTPQEYREKKTGA